MKNVLTNYAQLCIWFSLFLVVACQDDEPTPLIISVEPQEITISENPQNGMLIGDLDVSTNRMATLSFSLTDENPVGALSINESTGEIFIADASLFDYEVNPTITAVGNVSSEGITQKANITVSLTDVNEISITANEFTASIDENSADGTVIGTVDATLTSGTGTLAYSIVNQSVSGALAIDANTGELTVADASAFDYETNPTLSGTYKVGIGTVEEEGSITIDLNDLSEIGNGTEFALTFRTSRTNQPITIPVNAFEYTYNYTVDWGDGNTDSGLTDNTTHQYTSAGDYQVLISGTFPAIFFNFSSSEVDETRLTLISIDQWGTNPWQTMKGAFADCDQVTLAAIDRPDLSQVTSLASMFRGAASFNGDINDWDVSNITDFGGLFSGANTFNQPLDNWDMSNAIRTVSMFRGATAFNQDISSWDVSNVKEMSRMFQSARSFNQPLNTWDVGNVRSMNDLFNEAFAFNQPLNNWNVSRVENMERMFRRAGAFKQDLNDWDMSSVFSIEGMFQANAGFNGAIGDWDVSNVVNMTSTFSQAAIFNQDISNWDVSSVTNMSFMFSQTNAFNQDISGWDVSNVRNMSAMFQRNVFNQDIGNWDVSSVTNMSLMFNSNTSFNQDLTGWDVARVTNCANFRRSSTLTPENSPNFTNCTQ